MDHSYYLNNVSVVFLWALNRFMLSLVNVSHNHALHIFILVSVTFALIQGLQKHKEAETIAMVYCVGEMIAKKSCNSTTNSNH